MGPDWRPPPGWDSRAGLLGGSRGFSQILEQTEGRLIWAISKRREAETIAEGPGSWNRGGRRSRPRIGKAGTPESEGRWMDGISVAQLSITILPSASPPCPDEPPTKPQAPKEGRKPNYPPPSWVQCTQVGPEHNLSVGVANSIADLCARGLCVSISGCVCGCLCLCVLFLGLCLPVPLYVCPYL